MSEREGCSDQFYTCDILTSPLARETSEFAGVCTYLREGMREIQECVRRLVQTGREVREVQLPHIYIFHSEAKKLIKNTQVPYILCDSLTPAH